MAGGEHGGGAEGVGGADDGAEVAGAGRSVDHHHHAVAGSSGTPARSGSGISATRRISGGSARSVRRAKSSGAHLQVLGVGVVAHHGGGPAGGRRRRVGSPRCGTGQPTARHRSMARTPSTRNSPRCSRLRRLWRRASSSWKSALSALDDGHGQPVGNGERPWLARSAASRRPSRKAGWAMAASASPRWSHRLALELGGAVLGDDDVDLVARGGDHRTGVEPRARCETAARRPP